MSIPGNYQPYAPRLDFGWIGQGWRLFTSQAGAWVGAIALYLLVIALISAAIAVPTGFWAYILHSYNTVMSAAAGHTVPPQNNPRTDMLHLLPFSVTMAIVSAILFGGFYRMALKQGRGEAVRASDLFSAFDVALPLAAVTLVFAAISEGIGFAFPKGGTVGSFISFLMQGLFVMAPFVIVDRRVGPVVALTESLALLRGQHLMGIFLYFVLMLLDVLGAIPCGLGIFATMPLLFLTLGYGYLVLTQQLPPVSSGYAQGSYGPADPGVWPPPPNI